VNWSLVTKGEKGASVVLLQFFEFSTYSLNDECNVCKRE
jgi:hypothetical protein